MLKTLDAVVFDIQDAGARFYTYPATLGYLLEAAAQTNTEVMVLDRPDPSTERLCRARLTGGVYKLYQLSSCS